MLCVEQLILVKCECFVAAYYYAYKLWFSVVIWIKVLIYLLLLYCVSNFLSVYDIINNKSCIYDGSLVHYCI